MSYASLQNLVDRYGERLLLQVADRADPPAGAIDAAVVAKNLGDADAVIDGYLAGRYVLPLVDVPPVLVSIAESIAIYKLHAYTPEQKIADEYKQALADLKMIAAGDIRLPIAGVEPAGSGAGGVQTIDRARDMTPENMWGFI